MRQFSTLVEFLTSKSTNTTANSTVAFQGYDTIGVGESKWQHNGVTGQTLSQSPTQLGANLLNDGNGNQWALIPGQIVNYDGTQIFPAPFGDNGTGGYIYDQNGWTKATDVADTAIPYIFPTVALFKASLIEFPDGKTIHLNDREADFIKITGTGTGNNLDVIASTSVNQSIDFIGVEKVNILQLGAVPDWNGTTGTDNTAVIVHAVTNYPKTIIPKGYDFAVGENGSCFWEGISNRRVYGGGGLHKIGAKGVFSFKLCTDIVVHHLEFDGQIIADEAANGTIIGDARSALNYAFAVSFAECTDCTARNNLVYDFAWDGLVAQGAVAVGGLTATQSEDITFHRNRLSGIRGTNIWVRALDGFEITKNKHSNAITFNQKANSMFAVEWCNNGEISQNRGFFCGDNFIGIGEQLNGVAEARNKNILINKNISNITRYHSILIAQGEDITVSGNIIDNAAYKDNMPGTSFAVLSAGVTVLGGSDGATTAPRNVRIKVHDNIINNSREYGIYAYDRSLTTLADSSEGIEIYNNTINSSGRDALATRIASGGILTQIQKAVKLYNNEITFCVGDGIRVFGDAKIRGNTCELNTGRGILIPADTIWGNTKLSSPIAMNICTSNGGSGIEMVTKDDGVFIANECNKNGFGSSPAAENGANVILHAGIGLRSVTRVDTSGNICDDNGSSGIATYLCFIVDNSQDHTSNNGGNFTVANLRSGIYMEGDGGTSVDSTTFMCKGSTGTEQQYAVRILFNASAVALDCKYDVHPLGLVGVVEKSSFNIP